jgi:hypothetical protein
MEANSMNRGRRLENDNFMIFELVNKQCILPVLERRFDALPPHPRCPLREWRHKALTGDYKNIQVKRNQTRGFEVVL